MQVWACMGRYGRVVLADSVLVGVIASGRGRRVEDHRPAFAAGVCSVVSADRWAWQRPDEYAPWAESVAVPAPHRRGLGHAAGYGVELRRI